MLETTERSLIRFSFSHLIVATALMLCFLAYGILVPATLVLPVAHAEAPPLEIEQTASVDYTEAGPQITYEASVTNTGAEPLTGVLITDVLPSGASLLYFSDPDESGWSSSQRETDSGLVALWRSPKPLNPGQKATLVYVVSIPWESVQSAEVDKDLPVASAQGWTQSAAETAVPVTIDQSQAPTATPPPTDTPTPRPTATATLTPAPTASPTAAASPTAVPTATQTEAAPATAAAGEVVTQAAPQATPATSEAAGSAGIPTIVIIAVGVVVLVVIVVWLVTKK